MKKTLAVAVAVMMSLSSAAVYAEGGKTEEILKTVKERVEIPAELNEFESSIRENSDGAYYTFRWAEDEQNAKSKYMYVTCNDEKVITDYGVYLGWDIDYASLGGFPQADEAALKKTAEDFLKKLNPTMEFEVQDAGLSLYDVDAYLRFKVLHNGIELYESGGGLTINIEDMSVTNMYFSYPDVEEAESTAELITPDEAKKAFAEKLGFELVYSGYYENGKQMFFPMYVNNNDYKYISAVDGEVFEYEPYDDLSMFKAEDTESGMAGGGNGFGDDGFTQAEQTELENIEGLLTKEQIEKKVRGNKLISIPKTYELKSVYLNRRYDDKNIYIYRMNFSDGKDYLNVIANAKDGEIYTINDFANRDGAENADRKTMEKAVKELTPSLSEAYKFDGEKMSRYENGIRVMGNSATVLADKNGKIVSYDISYSYNSEFQSLDGVLSKEEAAEKIFELGGYEPKYFVNYDKKAHLAYDFNKRIVLHALSGKSVRYNGEEVFGGYTYTDLENHYAKEYIEKLAEFEIGFEGGEFKPNEYITSAEWCTLLDKIYNGVKSENDEPLTREDAVVMFVKAIGLEKAAMYDDIFVQPFNDVTRNKGYIAVLKAMGVISGDENGNFNPNNNLTRAEAAVILYKFLSK